MVVIVLPVPIFVCLCYRFKKFAASNTLSFRILVLAAIPAPVDTVWSNELRVPVNAW